VREGARPLTHSTALTLAPKLREEISNLEENQNGSTQNRQWIALAVDGSQTPSRPPSVALALACSRTDRTLDLPPRLARS
jgi:hypothetical protein